MFQSAGSAIRTAQGWVTTTLTHTWQMRRVKKTQSDTRYPSNARTTTSVSLHLSVCPFAGCCGEFSEYLYSKQTKYKTFSGSYQPSSIITADCLESATPVALGMGTVLTKPSPVCTCVHFIIRFKLSFQLSLIHILEPFSTPSNNVSFLSRRKRG